MVPFIGANGRTPGGWQAILSKKKFSGADLVVCVGSFRAPQVSPEENLGNGGVGWAWQDAEKTFAIYTVNVGGP